MTAFIGTVIILSLLACIPLVFLFAGMQYALKKSAQKKEQAAKAAQNAEKEAAEQ